MRFKKMNIIILLYMYVYVYICMYLYVIFYIESSGAIGDDYCSGNG